MEPGTLVGRFVVERALGEGGMGVVYAGRDPHLDRRVAIKLLRRERTGSGDRLLREAQALAQLSHPNVVGVYEVGVHDDQIFIAMELVEGQGLDRIMASGRLPWRRALELLVQAGRGLVAAHAKGIVHRDFKPSNVIVASDGRVRVADFGLARLASADSVDGGVATTSDGRPSSLETTVPDTGQSEVVGDASVWTPSSGGRLLDAPLTKDGTVLGTPRYMAPEQHLGRAATESWDVYSFCLVVWEALYGALPFAGDDIETLARNKAAGRIVRPDDAPPVPRWLVRAVERGLAPDPAHRHGSMAALVAILETTPARRQRVALAGVAAAGAAMAAVAGFALAPSARRVGCDRSDASIVRAWTPAVRDRVVRALPDAGQTVAGVIDERVGTWRVARVEACRATHDRKEQSVQLLDRRAGCFERHRLELDALVAAIERGDAPGWRALEAARALPAAERCGAAPLAGVRPASTSQPATETERLIAESRTAYRLGQSEKARTLGAQAVAAARPLGDPRLLAEALEVNSNAVGELDPVARRTMLEEALGFASDAGDPTLELRAADELLDLAVEQRMRERVSTLLPIVAAAMRRAGSAADTQLRADVKIDEMQGLSLLTRHADAARACDELAAIMPDKEPHCRCYVRLDQFPASSRAACEKAVEVAERVWGRDHPEVASALVNLSGAVRNSGDYQVAIALARRALAIDEKTHGEASHRVQRDLGVLSNALADAGNFEEAATVTSRALALLENSPIATDGARASLLAQRADQKVHLGKPEDGKRDAIAALAAAKRHWGADHANIAFYHFRLAQTLKMGLGDCAAAEPAFRQVIELSKATLGETSEMHMVGLTGAAECLVRLDRAREARPLFEEAMRIAPALEMQPYNRAMLFAAYGECLSVLGDRAGAIREFGKAREILVTIPEAQSMVEQVDAFVKRL